MFLIIFVALPLVLIMGYAFVDEGGGFTLNNISRFFSDSDALSTFAVSIEIALETTAICLLLGYPVAWLLANSKYKASGGDGIPVELFQILKDDAVKVLHSICQQIWKTQQWPQDWKRSVFIPIPKKGNAKECSNYCTIALISHASKVMLKILQARLQQYMNGELPGVQAGFRKGRRTRDQITSISWIIEKAREFQKNIYFCFIFMPKPLTVWITINCGKF